MDQIQLWENQAQTYKDLIEELKKSSPDKKKLQKYMEKLNLKYHLDDFENMQEVLTHLKWESDPISQASKGPQDV